MLGDHRNARENLDLLTSPETVTSMFGTYSDRAVSGNLTEDHTAMSETTTDHISHLASSEPSAGQPGQTTRGRAVRKAATKAPARRPSRRASASTQADLFDVVRLDADDHTPVAESEVAADRTELRHELEHMKDDGSPLVHRPDDDGDDGDAADDDEDRDDDDHGGDDDDSDDEGDDAGDNGEDPATSPTTLIAFGSGAWLPSSDPPPPATFAAALAMLEAHGDLSARQIERLRSDVRVAARLCGRTPETLPTDPLALRPLLVKVIPGAATVRASRWSSIRSTLRRIAVGVGAHAPRLRAARCDDAAWQMVLDAAPETPQRPALRRFVEWAVAEGLRPETITDEHLRHFSAWRAATTHDLFLAPMVSAARRLWNAMVSTAPGFPGQRLVARGRDARRTLLAVSDLPPVLQRELAAFAERLVAPVNPWEGKPLSSATVRLYTENIRRALTLLAGRPQGLSDISSLADLATPRILREILEADWLANGRRWREGTPQISAAIISYASRVLGFSDEQLRPLRELARRVKPEHRGKLAPAIRRKLGAFDDDAVRGALYRAGASLRAEGERLRRDGSVIRGAERFRAGVAIDLLLRGCLRRRTLVEIDVAKHLVRGRGGRIEAVHLDGSTTKNNVEIRIGLSPDLARALDRYLAVHRPELPGAESNWLFPSPRPGAHLGADGWGRSLAQLVERHVGTEFTPHLARHIAASMLFAADSEAGRAVQHVLGHADPRTSRKYGVLRNAGAQRAFGELVDAAVARRHRRHARSAR